jgi:hypothetical protein
MMVRWRNILLPFLVASLCYRWVSAEFWDGSKQALLVCLSVIAAGVLVRLARALPFTTADQYELDEIRRLTKAVAQIARSLRVLLIAVLVGMIGLVVARPVVAGTKDTAIFAAFGAQIEGLISGILGFVFAYVLFRMLQVVRGDQDLTDLQSGFVVRAVERKQADRFTKRQEGSAPFRQPEDFGKPLQ